MTIPDAIHASCAVVGETGILILGPSGSGKSTLARALVSIADGTGRFAALVGDDRILLTRHGDVLVARSHPALLGRLEIRSLGLVSVPAEPACVIGLVVECGADPPRLPDAEAARCDILDTRLPRLAVARGGYEAAYTVLYKCRDLYDTTMAVPRP